MKQLTVAHICPSYLPISETFIHRYLTSFKSLRPLVLAGAVENLELFPLDAPLYDCSHRRCTFRWILNGLGSRLAGDYDLYRRFLIKRHGAKIIHAHFGPTGYEALGLKRSTGLPLVTTFYGYDMSSLPKKNGWMAKYAELFETGDLFLVEGSHMKQKLVELGCPKEKVDIQHIAIDTEQFAFRKRLPKSDGSVILFFCGRFTEKKGLLYALKAFETVQRKFQSIRFRIVGDGEQRPEVEQFIKQYSLSGVVDLLGYQSHTVVAQEIDRADIFIQPSVTAANGDTEGGAPTILLEAQASGIPVLTTWHADIPEVTLSGKSALLSEERNWEDLAQNLEFMIQHQTKWVEFGEAGRKHIEDNYNIAKEVLTLEMKYRDLI
jgi:colanic acid/amylovoran biosynthesis glycosyltransferase